MKSKKSLKKLSLNKETLSVLSKDSMHLILGGLEAKKTKKKDNCKITSLTEVCPLSKDTTGPSCCPNVMV